MWLQVGSNGNKEPEGLLYTAPTSLRNIDRVLAVQTPQSNDTSNLTEETSAVFSMLTSDDDLVNALRDAVPELTRDNYHEWARKIRGLLSVQGLDGGLKDTIDVYYDDEIHHDDPKKLWDDLEKHIVPKGISAFIQFHLQFVRLRLEEGKDPDDFFNKQYTILLDRDATGVTLTRDLEIIIHIYTALPEEFGYLRTRWSVSDFKGLIAFEVQKQGREAQELLEVEKQLRRTRNSRNDGKGWRHWCWRYFTIVRQIRRVIVAARVENEAIGGALAMFGN
ncbi:uncharacterized protein PAC_06456 [Phialocephala subalpina]|uniref:Uncharacterized protein n=1 Tax=Phialocephala subalpina TaxID=576137 RepID=A0A1L7WUV7_9HELO|nr:uncharacterized protein PAC_06456 [Phialocephala subalpina]